MTTPDSGPAGPSAGDLPLRPPRFEPPSVLAAQSRQSQRFLLLVVRLLFLVLLVTVTVLTVASKREEDQAFELSTVVQLFGAAMAVGVIVVLVDVLTPHKRLSSVFGVYLGLCAGLIGALAVGTVIDVVTKAWQIAGPASTYVNLAKVIIAIILCYLAVSIVLTTKDDFRLVVPYVEFAKQVRGVRPMLLDTSVLIDGRIASLGETSFLDAPLVVPSFVIDELQTLADSGDKLKRERGRRGLAMLSKLQSSPYIDLSLDESKVEGRSVDHMLLEFAAQQSMRILTTDHNLAKVAEIRGVAAINLNDLANSLKTQVVPGERLTIEIVKPGESPGQGVGYLPDGTMVVVEDGSRFLNEDISVVVTNSVQTSAGRLIFAKLPETTSNAGAESPSTTTDSAQRVEHMARSATSQPRITARPDPAQPRDPRDADSRRNPRR